MIISIGIDIVEIDKIKESIVKSKRFIERIFTKYEKDYCEAKENKYQHYAVRFAAKEAVMKALGTGWDDGVQWKQIEIQNNTKGKPKVILSGKAEEIMQELNADKIFVSLTHNIGNAVAMVIFEGCLDEEIYF